MKRGRQIIIGTRGSPLALAQANIVLRQLRKKSPDVTFRLKKIKTEGDSPRNVEQSGSAKDLFTGAIDKALEDREIDVAVHSLKDLPAGESPNIEIAAYPKREDTHDVLISRKRGKTLRTLPRGAIVGTSSARRKLQVKTLRPDVQLVNLHGNVGTRIEKMSSSNLDAIVLARAGLNRLGKSLGKSISHRDMLPAVGQGCLVVTVRKGDDSVRDVVSKIDHRKTRLEVSAEREFSRALGADCNSPVAALASVDNGKIRLKGLMETTNGSKIIVKSEAIGAKEDPEGLGRALAQRLKKLGSGK